MSRCNGRLTFTRSGRAAANKSESERFLLRSVGWWLFISAAAGCTTHRANERVAYWREKARLHVPVESRIEDAQAYFASQGLELRCCMSGPDIDQAYSAAERNIGRFAWTEYSALIVVDASPEHRVSRVRVLRVGVRL
jgi:hypothetical protein